MEKDPADVDFSSASGNTVAYPGTIIKRDCDVTVLSYSVVMEGDDCHIVIPAGSQVKERNSKLYLPDRVVNCPQGGKWDSVHCIIMERPWDVTVFVRPDGKAYYSPHFVDPCPYQPERPFKAVWDSKNCHLELPNHVRDTAWKYQGKTLYYPGSPNCPEGGWWDGHNCKIMADPPSGGIWRLHGNQDWYYPPNQAVDCAYNPFPPFHAEYDSRNCYIPLPATIHPYICCDSNLMLYDNQPDHYCDSGGSYDGTACLISSQKRFRTSNNGQIYYPSIKTFSCPYHPAPFVLKTNGGSGEDTTCILTYPTQAALFLIGKDLYVQAAYADLSPYDSKMIPSPFPTPGVRFQIGFYVANRGNLESGPFKVNLTLKNGAANVVDTKTISAPSIAPGYQEFVYWDFTNGLPAGGYTVYADVDIENTVQETNEANNSNLAGFNVNR